MFVGAAPAVAASIAQFATAKVLADNALIVGEKVKKKYGAPDAMVTAV